MLVRLLKYNYAVYRINSGIAFKISKEKQSNRCVLVVTGLFLSFAAELEEILICTTHRHQAGYYQLVRGKTCEGFYGSRPRAAAALLSCLRVED